MQSNDDFLTVDEAARLTGYSHWSILVLGWLPATRYMSMGRVLVSRAELLELVKPRKAVQP